jgi:beta-glucosidase
MSTLQFPPGFSWGTATSSFQIEGAAEQRGDSIWDVFCRVPGAIADGSDGRVAIDHYHRYREDVALMASLGLDTYRFSVSWPRVIDPDGSVNPAGIGFYDSLVDALCAAGLRPWLTLYHWDLPAWMPGGWTSRATADAFADYALRVHAALGDRVRVWTTLNEPWCASFLSYAGGQHAPGHTNPGEAYAAAHHLLLGHGLAVRALRAADPAATLGLTLNFTPGRPADPGSAADADVVRRTDGTQHRLFTDAVFRGAYPADVIADAGAAWPGELVRDGDLELIASPIDVLGVNYYTSQLLRAGEPSPGPSPHPSAPDAVVVDRPELGRTDMGWEVTPDAFRDLLIGLHRDYTGPAGIPLAITENGAAIDDPDPASGAIDDQARIDYLRGHLRAVHEAVEAGAQIDTYLVWSLIDNFEWAFGYTKRFGLVAVDGALDRLPKASARWFAELTRTGTLCLPEQA